MAFCNSWTAKAALTLTPVTCYSTPLLPHHYSAPHCIQLLFPLSTSLMDSVCVSQHRQHFPFNCLSPPDPQPSTLQSTSTTKAQVCPWSVFLSLADQKKDSKGKRHECADKARIVAASICATKAGRVAETFKSECRGSVAGRAGNRVGRNPKEKRWGRPSDQTGVLQVRDPLLSTSVIPTE